jgi:hypothetical protein
MEENLSEEQNNQIEEFEKNILDPDKTGGIKYSIDRDIEASVKYDFLKEIYGTTQVELALHEEGKSLLDLSDLDTFKKISEILGRGI